MANYNKNGAECKGKEMVYASDENGMYFVQKCTTGVNSGHLLDTNSIWFVPGEERAVNKRTGRKVYTLQKVTKSCFEMYLKYLQTKNPLYIKNAEREIQ